MDEKGDGMNGINPNGNRTTDHDKLLYDPKTLRRNVFYYPLHK
jgi:hypothetical protein